MRALLSAGAAVTLCGIALAGGCGDQVGPSLAGKEGPGGPVSSAMLGKLQNVRPSGPAVFTDDFERAEIGSNWSMPPGAPYKIEGGVLRVKGAYNKALWLNVPLPDSVIVEFDAWSRSSEGDVKCEIFGDGAHHESGYIVIFGGWSNKISAIAKLDEHEKSRVELHDSMVIGKKYKWRVVRLGQILEFYTDGVLRLTRVDPAMLRGPGHDRLALNNWTSDSYYDNVAVFAATLAAAGSGAAASAAPIARTATVTGAATPAATSGPPRAAGAATSAPATAASVTGAAAPAATSGPPAAAGAP